MISLMRKLLARHDDRLFFAGIIVIAANAGGAWSPIGDVTTTMLWIGGQITALNIMISVFLPAVISLLVPLAITSFVLRGRPVESPKLGADTHDGVVTTEFERNLMFFLGLGILVAVPAFKTITHLPPFLGILFGLGILWLVGDLVHRKKEDEFKQRFTLAHALSRIDMSLAHLLPRHPAGCGDAGAHAHPVIGGAMARQDHRASRHHRGCHRPGQRHRRQRAAGGRIDGHVRPEDLPAPTTFSGSSWPTAPAPAAPSSSSARPPAWPPWAWRRSTSSGTCARSAGLRLIGYFAGALVYVVQYRLTH